MNKWIIFLLFLFVLGMGRVNAQALTQTYTDRCTGKVHVFTVPLGGETVISFYDRSKQFTSQDFINGTLQAWLEETYAWWSALSPCSTNQSTTTTAQQTAQNAASSAASAATSTPTTPPPAPSSSTTSSNSTSSTSTTSTESSTTSTSSETTTESSSSTSESSTESSSESKSEGGSEETSESSESESSEESESESSESEEESSEEESSEESSDEEEEEEEKQSNLAPPIISANTVTMSMLDGSVSQAFTFGYSQSSLTGQTTYSANTMIWSNLKQFSLNLSKSTVRFNMDRKIPVEIEKCSGGFETIGHRYGPGSIRKVQTVSAGGLKMFGTYVATVGLSDVFLGQKDNFWKGSAGGYALNAMVLFTPESNPLLVTAVTGFFTKPVKIKSLKRYTFTPMAAYSATPLTVDLKTGEKIWNKNGTYILGTNVDLALTKRFNANIGGNLVGNTAPGIPMSWMITIGSRFSF